MTEWFVYAWYDVTGICSGVKRILTATNDVQSETMPHRLCRENVFVFFSSKFPSSFQKLEDTELELKPLPVGRLVTTPDGLPNDTFGDIAMITEFISCYSGLLMPNNQFPIHTG